MIYNLRLLLVTFALILGSTLQAKTCNLFIVGTGVVGSELLQQIEQNADKLYRECGIEFRVVGIASSRTMYIQDSGISLSQWRQALDTHSQKMSWNNFLASLVLSELPNRVFVDCTSDQTIADTYETLLSIGISVVTASKKANSASFEYYKKLQHAGLESRATFYYDANVGAGLPILSTIKSLKRSGDEIGKIEGVFSGTLSYLFNTFEKGMSFSELVKEAQKQGYTEPDPRDDLNGMDVARKLLIAVREAGYSLELGDIELKRFLPDECFEGASLADFYQKLQTADASMARLRDDAASQGKRLRYIASFVDGKAEISLQAVPANHPFYSLNGCDNICAITSKYYNKSPLVFRGPGAGGQITAAKVFDNVIQTANEMH